MVRSPETSKPAAPAKSRDVGPCTLSALRQALGIDPHPASQAVSTGWDGPDRVLAGAGLSPRMVHEWIGAGSGEAAGEWWTPPLAALAHLAGRAVTVTGSGARTLWVGRGVWPFAPLLAARSLLAGAVLIDTRGPRETAWAVDLALRGRGFAAVIADGRGLDLALTRRLQLAAESGGGLALLARAASERDVLSASGTRWLVRPVHAHAPASVHRPRWAVHLLRRKGLRPTPASDGCWTVELDHATGALSLLPDVAHRPGAAARAG